MAGPIVQWGPRHSIWHCNNIGGCKEENVDKKFVSAAIPSTAKVLEVAAASQFAKENKPWDQCIIPINKEGDWFKFYYPVEEKGGTVPDEWFHGPDTPGGKPSHQEEPTPPTPWPHVPLKYVGCYIKQWSSDQDRYARIRVTFELP